MPDGLISLSLEGRKPPTREPFQLKLIFDPMSSVPILTLGLIAVNTIVFGLMELKGGSTDTATLIVFGAAFGPLVKHGEYWRLLTSAFLHIGILHLVFNMWALLLLGQRLEPIVGTVRFGVIYFVSALSGSLLGLWALPLTISAGASGAIFGIAGAMLIIGARYPKLVPQGVSQAFGRGILPFLIYNIVFGVFNNLTQSSNSTQINLAAHLGGALGGMACALALKPSVESPRARWVAVSVAATVVFGAFLFPLVSPPALGLNLEQLRQGRKLQPVWALLRTGKTAEAQAALEQLGDSAENSPDFHILRGAFMEDHGDRAGAQNEFHKAVAMAPGYAGGHRALGMALVRVNKFDAAIAELRTSIRLDDSDPNSHLFLAQSLLAEHATDDAIRESRIAARLNPKWPNPHWLLAVALRSQGKNSEAASELALAAQLSKTGTPMGQQTGGSR